MNEKRLKGDDRITRGKGKLLSLEDVYLFLVPFYLLSLKEDIFTFYYMFKFKMIIKEIFTNLLMLFLNDQSLTLPWFVKKHSCLLT